MPGPSLGGNQVAYDPNQPPGQVSIGGSPVNNTASNQAPNQQPTGQQATNANSPGQNWYSGPQSANGFNTPGYQFGMDPSGAMQNSINNTQVNMGQNTQAYNPYQNSGQAGLDTSRINAAQMPVGSVNQGQQYYDRMQDAYYNEGNKRLAPRMEQEQTRLETQLQNQGLTRGSSAWNAEMDRMMNARNDAYSSLTNQAIMSSGQEAARMQGMDINAGNFANQAAQQNYMNQLSSQNQFNQANQQNWQNQFNAGNQGFQNQLAGQAAQNQAIAAQNAASGQQFGQNLAQGSFANQAQQQGFAQQLARANLNNSAFGQQEQNRVASEASRNSLSAAYANSAAQQNIASQQLAQRQQEMEFNQALEMGMYPYRLQQLQMQGMYPQGDPNMPNFSTPNYNSPNNYYNSGMASNQQQGQQNSLGGNLIGQGINLFSRYMGF